MYHGIHWINSVYSANNNKKIIGHTFYVFDKQFLFGWTGCYNYWLINIIRD